MKRWCFLLVALSALTGCLDMEVEHTLYVEPDGGLTWTILEHEVRSLEETAEARELEELDYLGQALAGRSSTADALHEIGATSVEVEVVRDRRPYAVLVTAEFVDPAAAIAGLLHASDVDAHVGLTPVGGRSRRLTIVAEGLEQDGLRAAVGDEPLRFVMTAGRFVEAEGFRLEDDGRVAVWEEPEGGEPSTRPIRRTLTWDLDAPE